MYNNQNGDSGANTVLILVVLVVLVGFVLWWSSSMRSAPVAPQNSGVDVKVDIPTPTPDVTPTPDITAAPTPAQ